MTSTKDFDRRMAQAKEIDALQAENIRLRAQAEALATALETVLYYAETYTVARFERGKVADARAALRAYREGTPCSVCGDAGVDAQGYECSCKEASYDAG